MNRNKLLEIGLVLFAISWIFIIGVDYLNKHPWYQISIEYFRFPKLVSFLGIFSFTMALGYRYVSIFKRIAATGPGLFSLFIIFLVALGLSYSKYALGSDPTISELWSYLSMNLKSLFFLIVLSTSAYLYGSLFNIRILTHPIYKVAFGLIIICLLLFAIAALMMLNPIGISIVLFLPMVISYKNVVPAAKGLLIKKWSLGDLNFVGVISLCLLVFYMALNFAYDQAPFPVGFDTRNFYMNISKQLAFNEGLIYGYRPYNWSLMISLGFALFKSTPVAISISIYGYMLALFAMFHLGTKRLGLSANKVIFGMLFFTVTPAISNQLFIELKTDMALLFIQLVTISLFLKFIDTPSFKAIRNKKSLVTLDKKKVLGPVALIGFLIGFGLGIKMTNMFLLFSIIICLFWILNDDFLVTAAIILMTLGLFVLVRLDDLSGVRSYHLGLNQLALILLISGGILMGYLLFRNFKSIIPTVVLVMTMGFFAILPLSPWLIKSYNETRSLSPSALLNGANPGPNINIHILDTNYKNSKR